MGANSSKSDTPTMVPPSATAQTQMSSVDGDQMLFDAKLISEATVREAAELGLLLRPLKLSDYEHGYLELLSQLTTTGNISKELFQKQLEYMIARPNTYFIVVIEDIVQKRIIATGTVVIEAKFTHECGQVGHIEDIVTDQQRRGQSLGRRIIEQLVFICKSQGCYKVILDSAEKNAGFYEKLGFKRKELQLALYFE